MKTILTLIERDIYPNNEITPESEYLKSRRTTRIVIFDTEGNVALGAVNEGNDTFRYSIIGGGIDEGELIEDALIREALEETGCKIKNIQELGTIEERGIGNEFNKRRVQFNYCFTADVDGEKNNPQFTKEDVHDGLTVVWLSLEEAIRCLKNQKDSFITRRTLFLLEEAKRVRFV
ncbi:MAG: NUDIX domain-containing protein [Candidatus Pacebacteria bacterium]|nr:NUDIX domain-containing protein [Candidatus Paceibacterota bacterium]MBP9866715.1 NUDIX domain-containing protein [Candidatus Paceibacterota bacterium]